jgi:hypothetical protein
MFNSNHWQDLLWFQPYKKSPPTLSPQAENIFKYLVSIQYEWARLNDLYHLLDKSKTKLKDGGRTNLRRNLATLIQLEKVETQMFKTKIGRYRRYRVKKGA